MARMNDDNFYSWQGNLVNLVVLNQMAWGIDAMAVNTLVSRRAAYEPLYMKAQNKTTRTRGDVLAHREAREVYEKEINRFVNAHIRFNDLMTNTDRSNVGVPKRDTELTPRGKIDVIPYINLKAIGGGEVQVRARTESDQTRASMLNLADAVECRYILVPKGEMPPEGQKDAKTTVVSKKARFTISLGDEQAGESFWGFFRWVNQSNPANSGPWSKPHKAVIA